MVVLGPGYVGGWWAVPVTVAAWRLASVVWTLADDYDG